MTIQIEAMKMMVEAITEMNDLISETSGVYGLHLNGDPSPWGEIEAGGRFERLTLKDDALAAGRAAIEAAEKVEPVAWMITTSNSNLHPLDPNRESNWLTFDLIDFKRNCARSLKVEGSIPLYTAPAVPSYDAEKWQLVPKVATLAMIEAVSLFDQHSCVHTYRAMLAAAPKPEDK